MQCPECEGQSSHHRPLWGAVWPGGLSGRGGRYGAEVEDRPGTVAGCAGMEEGTEGGPVNWLMPPLPPDAKGSWGQSAPLQGCCPFLLLPLVRQF